MSLSMSNNSIRLFNAPFSVSRWAGTGGSDSSLLKFFQSLCNFLFLFVLLLLMACQYTEIRNIDIHSYFSLYKG
jgi:hypothetical protein